MLPKVSCMMLTYNRFIPFKRAVRSFIAQTYSNRELIIVNSGDRVYRNRVEEYLYGDNGICEKYGVEIHHIENPPMSLMSLGSLRNLALNWCTGEYVMVFDDDDVHHKNRIETQIKLCLSSNIDGTILRNFTAIRKKRFFKDTKDHCTMLPGLEGTLLFRKGDVRYPDMNQGEDTGFLEALKEDGYKIMIIDAPYELYEYWFYGHNTVSIDHFTDMIMDNPPMRYHE